MEVFDSREFIINKAIAKNIVAELGIAMQKVEKNCLKDAEEYWGLYNQIVNSDNVVSVIELTKKLEKIQTNVIYDFSLKQKIQNLINKNKQRIDFLEKEINEQKINTFEFSQKQISQKFSDAKIELSEDKLNINSEKNTLKKAFFDNHLIILKSGQFDLGEKSNFDILNGLDDKNFAILLGKFPKSIATISDESLLNTKFKIRILKHIIVIADQMFKNKSAKEVNEYFGNLINVPIDSKMDLNLFISEIANMFNVRIKQYLIDKYPNRKKDIDAKLKCNEGSDYLPEIYRGGKYENQEIIDMLEEDINGFLNDLLDGDFDDISDEDLFEDE